MSKDYYQTLGVDKGISQDELKKAYRKLAHQHHPDKESGDEAKFKEISEAYSILGDEKKRKQYDQFGDAAFNGGQGAPGGGGFNWQGFGGQGGFQNANINFEDLGDLFGEFFGGGRPRKGQDYQMSVAISFMDAVKGISKTVNVDGRDLEVTLPRGINDGESIRLSAQGGAAPEGGQAGDLYIKVRVQAHKDFERRGNDIFSNIRAPFSLFIKGGAIDVPTVDGDVELKIPSATESGKIFKLKNKGVPDVHGRGRGDHFVVVHVEVPKKLSKKTKKALEELKGDGV
ncbi:MAG: DnaJ domain-containing protein [Candidatus Jacksonbacteria bacterium]|jgi:DnaJ-class molecular chaperone|nr:DnaJ domain-containing protein [Candidatus Jacksonbacteria bacterium]MBT6301359.1 DnaJ domain-containing protein [Candidatus Jacksonbacteria bacterium]MBT6756733.1 DnaJ domain-containing protein [Candidatus Jacksonbacteria bacterium]MBT6954987.1 DnaJ domain-containing protein [Candidatus Jacksonbacteria bacterium]MBT7008754.1 DnaJ domain-containing protein [Candidatus Jacksonbacteria bacterium]